MSYAVYFQNGPDAPHSIHVGHEPTLRGARQLAARALHDKATTADAAAWVDGPDVDEAPEWASEKTWADGTPPAQHVLYPTTR